MPIQQIVREKQSEEQQQQMQRSDTKSLPRLVDEVNPITSPKDAAFAPSHAAAAAAREEALRSSAARPAAPSWEAASSAAPSSEDTRRAAPSWEAATNAAVSEFEREACSSTEEIIHDAAEAAKAKVRDVAAKAAEAAHGNRIMAAALPADINAEAREALRNLGGQVADKVSEVLESASQAVSARIDKAANWAHAKVQFEGHSQYEHDARAAWDEAAAMADPGPYHHPEEGWTPPAVPGAAAAQHATGAADAGKGPAKTTPAPSWPTGNTASVEDAPAALSGVGDAIEEGTRKEQIGVKVIYI